MNIVRDGQDAVGRILWSPAPSHQLVDKNGSWNTLQKVLGRSFGLQGEKAVCVRVCVQVSVCVCFLCAHSRLIPVTD